MPPRGSKAEAAPASVWDLLATSNRPDVGKAEERKALLKYWGEGPLNFILGEDLDEREIVPGSGIYSRKLIWTSDEKDDQAPLKPFPEWEYIQRYITVLHEEREVVSDKARQMFMTTATLLYILWNCLFKFNRRWIWTKTTEDESIAHLQSKVRAVHARLPQWVKEALPISEAPQDTVLCLKTNSVIIAGAENVAIRAARGGTATGFGLDEGAFMDQFQVAWAAAAPMCGKIFALTTPNIGTRGATAYYALLERDSQRYVGDQDHSGKPVATSDLPTIQGFGVRRNSSGYAIVEVDLEADPDKRSPAYIEELHRRQPNQREFEREYRRNWTIAAGESFYPEFVNNGAEKAYVQPLAHLIAGPIFRCWDFGFRRPACYTLGQELLTKEGWKKIEDVLIGEEVLTLNTRTRQIEYQAVTSTLRYQYSGDIYRWKDRNTQIDVEVTENHLMVFEYKDGIIFKRADECTGTYRYHNPKGFWLGEPSSRGLPWFAMMGLYLSEGSCRYDGKHYHNWIWQNNRDPWMDKWLLKSGHKWRYYSDKRGGRGWCTAGRELFEYFAQFGHAREKFVPQEIKDATPAEISLFLDAYARGDGCKETGKITTFSKQMADDLQELFVKIGVSARVSKDGDAYAVQPHKYYRPRLRQKSRSIRTTENETVVCVTVPNHTLFVRKPNSSPIWCGNCLWFQIDPETERVWVIRELLCTNINTWAFADLVLHLSGELGLHELPEDTEQDVYKWVDRITADSRLPDPPWFEWEGMPPRFVDLCGPEVSKVNSHYEKDSKENTDAEILEGRGISVSITSAQWQARENVMRKLLRMKEDGYPGLLVDPACRLLIEALGGALCYALPSAANPMPDAPAKNGTHDNIHDALSYGLVQVVGLDEFAMKDGRYKGKGRLPPPPPQALFHEAQHTSAAFTHATRPRLGRAYR